jgi:Ni/Co efflux regulator RcnB
MKTIMLILTLALATNAFAHQHKNHKKNEAHDKEHSHVSEDKKDHDHDDKHHEEHDHKAHHPDHSDEVKPAKKK